MKKPKTALCFLYPDRTNVYSYSQIYVRREHLGLCYIAAKLRSSGFVCDVYDLDFDQSLENSYVKHIGDYDIVGYSVYETNYDNSLRYSREVKLQNPSAKVIWGGIFPSYNWRSLLKNDVIDYVCVGDGENVVQKLAEYMETLEFDNFCRIPGLACKVGKQPALELPPESADITSLPFPTREFYYKNAAMAPSITSIIGSRGCYAKCSFCLAAAYYRKIGRTAYRLRDARDVVSEMSFLKDRYGILRFAFMDLNFIVPNRKGSEYIDCLCEELEKRKLNIRFVFTCRANDIVYFAAKLKRLKDCGLIAITFSLESASNRQMNLFNKGFRKEVALKAIQILGEHRIEYRLYQILFDKKSTRREVLLSLKTMNRLGIWRFSRIASKLSIRKGTPLYESDISNTYDPEGEGYYQCGSGEDEYDYDFEDKKVDALYRTCYLLERRLELALGYLYDWINANNRTFLELYFEVEQVLKSKLFGLLYYLNSFRAMRSRARRESELSKAIEKVEQDMIGAVSRLDKHRGESISIRLVDYVFTIDTINRIIYRVRYADLFCNERNMTRQEKEMILKARTLLESS